MGVVLSESRCGFKNSRAIIKTKKPPSRTPVPATGLKAGQVDLAETDENGNENETEKVVKTVHFVV